MKTIRLPVKEQISEASIVAIGVFDGVHCGHLALLAEGKERARKLDAELVVVTFDPHPANIVRPEQAPLLLTTLDQRLELLADAGVDITVVVPFDYERSQQTADDFVKEIVVSLLNAKSVLVGYDFHFGHNRSGNVETLTALGRELGFDVLGLSLETENDVSISSTRIRELIATGELQHANGLLGRPFEVRGIVVHGDQRGRKLGFPTANLAVDSQILLPCDGVYAGWYERENGEVWPTAINVGRRPTFYENAEHSIVEAHLLDFDDDLYGENAKVRFVVRLRAEEKFPNAEALVAQMQRDRETARSALR
jgi:riboflavin kinase/FMN adenylyltransferase